MCQYRCINQNNGEFARYVFNPDALDTETKGNIINKAKDRNSGAKNPANVESTYKKFKDLMDNICDTLKKFKDALDFAHDVFDAFGNEGMANAAGDASTVVGSTLSGAEQMGQMAQGIASNLGPYGQAAGAAIGLAMGIAQASDKAHQRKIEELQREVSNIDNTLTVIRNLREKQLGYDKGQRRQQLINMYKNSTDLADKAMYKFYMRGGTTGTGYEQELKALEAQREKYKEMYKEEKAKKKESSEALEEYRTKIAELDQTIMEFSETLANELWGIDLKGWADQIADALMTAFENGTSAAAAFRDAVQDIFRTVIKNMMKLKIIEPVIEEYQEKLSGENGAFNTDDVEGSMGRTVEVLTEMVDALQKKISAAQAFYNAANDVYEQKLGFGMDASDSSSSGTSNSISSTATEETMGYVAGYLATMSQDMAARRIMFDAFVNQSWPSYIELVTGANGSLTSIDRNTGKIVMMMEEGNGALFDRVDRMSRRLDNITTGIDKVYTR